MEQRIEYIDIAKGIAIVLVVIGHVLCYDLYGFAEAGKSKLFIFIYSFHMPLFFFLSGLVSKTDLEWKEMPTDLWKRFRSLMVPFFVVGGIFSLWNAGNFGFLFHSDKWGYWYLWVLFVFYVICYPVSKIGRGRVGLVCQSIVSLAIWYVLLKAFEHSSPETVRMLSLFKVYCNFPYFVMGRMAKQFNMQKLVCGNSPIFILASIYWIFSAYIVFPLSEYFQATAAIIVVMNICYKIDKEQQSKIKNVAMFLGKSSLYIYIFHYFFLVMFQTSYHNGWLLLYSNFGIDFMLTVIPTILIIVGSLVIKFIVEREPVIMKYVFNKP